MNFSPCACSRDLKASARRGRRVTDRDLSPGGWEGGKAEKDTGVELLWTMRETQIQPGTNRELVHDGDG